MCIYFLGTHKEILLLRKNMISFRRILQQPYDKSNILIK